MGSICEHPAVAATPTPNFGKLDSRVSSCINFPHPPFTACSLKTQRHHARHELLVRLGQQLASNTDTIDITLRGTTPCCSKKSSGKARHKSLFRKALASLWCGTARSARPCCGRTVVVHLTPDDLSVLECAGDDLDTCGDYSDADLEATAVESNEDCDAGDIGTFPI